MTQATQTKALRLADELERIGKVFDMGRPAIDDAYRKAAAELRRLDAAEQTHARELRAYRTTVENLEKQLNDMLSVSDEMVDAAIEAYMPFGGMRCAIEAAIAAASR